jgi:tetratricopeptide (TPR) repeat protein
VVAAALVAFSVPAGVVAKGAPKAPPSPSPSPSPSPTATPEPLAVQIPRLEGLLKANPNDRTSATELAQDYYSVNRPDLALGLTTRLIQSGTKTAQVYYLDGISHAELGQQPQAIASLEQAGNLEPTNVAVLGALTNLYLRSNRPADAERIAKRAITFNPKDVDALDGYGQVLAAEQKYDDARVQFEAAAKLDPKNAHPLVLEANTYADQNAVALAAQEFDRAVTADPTSIEALAGKARVQSFQHDVPGAITTYNLLLAQEKSDDARAAVMGEMGKLYAVEHMDSDADATYRKAIAAYPSTSLAHINYGDYLAFKKDYNGAEREWKLANGPNNDNPDAISRLGELYGTRNDKQRAITEFKRLTEIARSNSRSWLLLGNAYASAGQFDQARKAFLNSYAIERTADAIVGLGNSDYQIHNYKEAAQIFSALDRTPNFSRQNPQMLFLLGQSYAKLGDKSHARDAYARFLPYTKPGSQANTQVKQMMADLNKPAPKPSTAKAAAKPKPSATKAAAKPKPSATKAPATK